MDRESCPPLKNGPFGGGAVLMSEYIIYYCLLSFVCIMDLLSAGVNTHTHPDTVRVPPPSLVQTISCHCSATMKEKLSVDPYDTRGEEIRSR